MGIVVSLLLAMSMVLCSSASRLAGQQPFKRRGGSFLTSSRMQLTLRASVAPLSSQTISDVGEDFYSADGGSGIGQDFLDGRRVFRLVTSATVGTRPENSPTLVLNADYSPLSFSPLSLWSWQDSLRAVFNEKATVVSEYDAVRIRSVRLPRVSMTETE
jgi:hypothetical protein